MTRTAELHRRAMEVADRALIETLHARTDSALKLYQEAFQLEREAAIEASRLNLGEPTISVLHRSAATLALDAGETREAEKLIALALAQDPPDSIAEELRDLLEQVTFRRHLALRGVQLNPSEFQLALTGAAVGFGIVSSADFIDRVETVEKLVYRTAERKMNKPFREGGRRNKALQNEVDLFVSVPRAASFAVTFRIGSSFQASLLAEPNL
jgi:tetratricopeptide (TPR) repeat protein